ASNATSTRGSSTASRPRSASTRCRRMRAASWQATPGGASPCAWETDRVNTAVLVVGSIFAGLAAIVHIYIWVLESVLWMRESTRRTFGVRTTADAETLRPMAYNQGY